MLDHTRPRLVLDIIGNLCRSKCGLTDSTDHRYSIHPLLFRSCRGCMTGFHRDTVDAMSKCYKYAARLWHLAISVGAVIQVVKSELTCSSQRLIIFLVVPRPAMSQCFRCVYTPDIWMSRLMGIRCQERRKTTLNPRRETAHHTRVL